MNSKRLHRTPLRIFGAATLSAVYTLKGEPEGSELHFKGPFLTICLAKCLGLSRLLLLQKQMFQPLSKLCQTQLVASQENPHVQSFLQLATPGSTVSLPLLSPWRAARCCGNSSTDRAQCCRRATQEAISACSSAKGLRMSWLYCNLGTVEAKTASTTHTHAEREMNMN